MSHAALTIMTELEKLNFDRSRGIVWVCDVIGSSKYLNQNETAGELEEFLSRLYWLSMQAVKAAEGRFIKWTGDGFLAWFETPLHRDVETKAGTVFLAATQLSILVAMMQLGLTPKVKFTIRHSITLEHDALITKIEHHDGHVSVDIIGRAVVLAFRLCGVKSGFPRIITQGDLVRKSNRNQIGQFRFTPVTFKPEDYLRYFKGEKWGTDSIYKACKSRWTKREIAGVRAFTSNLATPQNINPNMLSGLGIDLNFIVNFINYMNAGPEWSKGVLKGYFDFLMAEVFLRIPVQHGDTKENDKEFLSEFRKISKDIRTRLGLK
jgi:class 3 adenylate cyclase